MEQAPQGGGGAGHEEVVPRVRSLQSRPHLGESWNGERWTLPASGAWGCLLEDHTARSPGPFREEGPTVSSWDRLPWDL